MSEENLKVVITGDASGLDKTSAQAATSLNKVSQSAAEWDKRARELNVQTNYTSRAFSSLSTNAAKVVAPTQSASRGLTKLGTSGKQANFAMISLGQGIGDIPYGFNAIVNNVQQTVQAFGYLKATSGSTGGALKALGSSLMGPTGLFIGFSLVSSIITALVQKYGSLGAAATALFGHLTDQEKAQKNLNDAIADSSKEVQTNIVGLLKVQSTVDLAAQGYVSAKRAVNQFNKELGPTFGNVNSLSAAQDKLNTSSQAYIQSVIFQTVAMKLFSQAAKSITDNVETQAKANNDVATGWEKTINFFKAGFSSSNRTWADVFKQFDKLNDASGASEKRLSQLTSQNAYGKLTKQAQGFLKTAAEIAKQAGVGIFGDGDKGGGGKLKTIAQIMADLATKTAEVDAKQKILGLTVEQVGANKMKDLSDAMNALARISTPEAIAKAKELGAQYDKIGKASFLPTLTGGRAQVNAPGITTPGVPTTINTDTEAPKADPEKILKYLQLTNEQMKLLRTAGGELQNVFGSVFSELAQGQSPIHALISAIESLIIQLAAAAAAAAILAVLTGGGSTALGAASGDFTKIFGMLSGLSIQSHAKGAFVPGPQLAVVGDAPGGEWVLNQKQISAILNGSGGGRNVNISGNFRIQGNDLVAAVNNTNKRNGRIN